MSEEIRFTDALKHTNNVMLAPVDYETERNKLNEAGV
ncbi:hypothetical protein shim_08740 [Shimia sp. SK013]|nr:hypothetical protein shim_08740 [Shimia sp. SK013]